MNIVVCITDQRMQKIANLLKKKANVYEIRKSYDAIELFQNKHNVDVMILPINSSDEKGKVKLKDGLFPILEAFKEQELIIFAGKNRMDKINEKWKWIDLSCFKEIKDVNAELTAQGILDILICKTSCNFKSYTYDILGYGACGKAIAHLLDCNECNIRIITRQKIEDPKLDFLDYNAWYQSNPNDIVINTASACVLTMQHLYKWNKIPWILDISSNGIGVQKEVLNYTNGLLLPALPLISGVVTSAEVIVKNIEKELGL